MDLLSFFTSSSATTTTTDESKRTSSKTIIHHHVSPSRTELVKIVHNWLMSADFIKAAIELEMEAADALERIKAPAVSLEELFWNNLEAREEMRMLQDEATQVRNENQRLHKALEAREQALNRLEQQQGGHNSRIEERCQRLERENKQLREMVSDRSEALQNMQQQLELNLEQVALTKRTNEHVAEEAAVAISRAQTLQMELQDAKKSHVRTCEDLNKKIGSLESEVSVLKKCLNETRMVRDEEVHCHQEVQGRQAMAQRALSELAEQANKDLVVARRKEMELKQVIQSMQDVNEQMKKSLDEQHSSRAALERTVYEMQKDVLAFGSENEHLNTQIEDYKRKLERQTRDSDQYKRILDEEKNRQQQQQQQRQSSNNAYSSGQYSTDFSARSSVMTSASLTSYYNQVTSPSSSTYLIQLLQLQTNRLEDELKKIGDSKDDSRECLYLLFKISHLSCMTAIRILLSQGQSEAMYRLNSSASSSSSSAYLPWWVQPWSQMLRDAALKAASRSKTGNIFLSDLEAEILPAVISDRILRSSTNPIMTMSDGDAHSCIIESKPEFGWRSLVTSSTSASKDLTSLSGIMKRIVIDDTTKGNSVAEIQTDPHTERLAALAAKAEEFAQASMMAITTLSSYQDVTASTAALETAEKCHQETKEILDLIRSLSSCYPSVQQQHQYILYVQRVQAATLKAKKCKEEALVLGEFHSLLEKANLSSAEAVAASRIASEHLKACEQAIENNIDVANRHANESFAAAKIGNRSAEILSDILVKARGNMHVKDQFDEGLGEFVVGMLKRIEAAAERARACAVNANNDAKDAKQLIWNRDAILRRKSKQ